MCGAVSTCSTTAVHANAADQPANIACLPAPQNPENLYDPSSATGGTYAAAQVIWDAFASRNGDGKRSIALMIIPLMGQFFCGLASLTSNSRWVRSGMRDRGQRARAPGAACGTAVHASGCMHQFKLNVACCASITPSTTTTPTLRRMLYAFSRDGAVPGSRWWHKVHPRTQTPMNAVWLCVFVAFLLGLPVLNSTVVSHRMLALVRCRKQRTVGACVGCSLPCCPALGGACAD